MTYQGRLLRRQFTMYRIFSLHNQAEKADIFFIRSYHFKYTVYQGRKKYIVCHLLCNTMHRYVIFEIQINIPMPIFTH